MYASINLFFKGCLSNGRNAILDTLKDINWDTFYQQKMALESLTDYLHRNKEQENGMFGRAAAWMEGILTMMDGSRMLLQTRTRSVIPPVTKMTGT